MPGTTRRIALVFVTILLIPLLAACNNDMQGRMHPESPVAEAPVFVSTLSATPSNPGDRGTPMASTVTPEPTIVPTVLPTKEPVATSPPDWSPRPLTPQERLAYKPNELGVIPVFMYHNIVDDPTLEGHLYRTYDELWNDLQWLYDNNFYLIGMNDLVQAHFDVPPGKHPVILTFDDSSSMHFSFQMGANGKPLTDANGEFIPTPNSAVGIIERFADEHPDFGRTAHFSTIPQFLFSWPEYAENEWYQAKIEWLMRHGYEIGNHTEDHNPLPDMTLEDFERNIANPYLQISEFIDENNPGFAMGIITLPFGAYPDGGWPADKFQDLAMGFLWNGQKINVTGALLVCCGGGPSPFDTEYSRLWIPRIRGDDPDYAYFASQIEKGEVVLFTSDGDPNTVTVPWPLPDIQFGRLNEEEVKRRGMELIHYDPYDGQPIAVSNVYDGEAYTRRQRAYMSV